METSSICSLDLYLCCVKKGEVRSGGKILNTEIKVLSKETIEQIAAGEVIENPSCVVKELVENSIDAGARHINIDIYNGGIDSVVISDDGTGIAHDQVEAAFLPHSTSKLRDISDLYTIKTMGFRGEALSSIAAVSRVVMTTKTKEELTGTRAVYEGEKNISIDDTGCPDGCVIEVSDLFFNVPARRKFLRTPQTEGTYASQVAEHLALCNPDIAFEMTSNGRNKLSTSGNGNVKDAIYRIYGREVASNLIEVDVKTTHLTIPGVIGKPVITRSSRALENYFINGRYIRSNIINKAIDDAYRQYMMLHQFPFTNLYIDISGEYTDVNVHPRKMELKFTESNKIYAEVFETIKAALSHRDMIPKEIDTVPVKERDVRTDNSHYAPYERRKLEAVVRELDETSPYKKIYDVIRPSAENVPPVVREDVQLDLSEVVTKEAGYDVDFKKEVENSNFTLIGQLFDTYWLVEMEEQLFIIDQHAAHEKILFEKNMKMFKERSFYSQKVMPAYIISLSSAEKDVLGEHMEYFAELGFEIEGFGDNEIALSAVPDNLYGISYEEFLRECLSLMKMERNKETEVMWHRIATASCKAAIKGNMRKSDIEAKNLIKELMGLEDPYHCPHGRPTIYTMSKSDIEKKFKRIV